MNIAEGMGFKFNFLKSSLVPRPKLGVAGNDLKHSRRDTDFVQWQPLKDSQHAVLCSHVQDYNMQAIGEPDKGPILHSRGGPLEPPSLRSIQAPNAGGQSTVPDPSHAQFC